MWFFLFYRARQDGPVLLVRFAPTAFAPSWTGVLQGADGGLVCCRDGSTLGMDTIEER